MPGAAEHADHAGAGIGRAAHDLQRLAVAGIDGQHLQLVGLRVTLGGEDFGDRNGRSASAGLAMPSTSIPTRVSAVGDVIDACIGIEMLLEPRQSELHAPTPADKVGTSRKPKP